MKVTYIGHSCFQLDSGQTRILLDPFVSGNPVARVKAEDLSPTHILLTHGHGDHLGDTEAIAKRTGALVITTFELAAVLEDKGVRVHPMAVGGRYRFDFGSVRVTPAFHGAGVAGGSPAGFIFHLEDKAVYHTGDTGLFSDMKLFAELEKVDLFLVPIGGNYTMDVDDAVVAVDFVRPAVAIPMHYNTFPMVKADPTDFKAKAESRVPGTQVAILQPGETLDF
ncbi:MAG: metal-dependent hydrolase [Symbiobacteriia bacterium]